MESTSQREIERMLQKYRMRRQEVAGAPLELHKNTRRMLHDEIQKTAARPFGSSEEAAQNFAKSIAWQSAPATWWNQFIPRFALFASVCGAVALVVFVFKREADRRAVAPGNDFLNGAVEMAKVTEPMPTPAPAPNKDEAGTPGQLPPLKRDSSAVSPGAGQKQSAASIALVPMEPQDPPLSAPVPKPVAGPVASQIARSELVGKPMPVSATPKPTAAPTVAAVTSAPALAQASVTAEKKFPANLDSATTKSFASSPQSITSTQPAIRPAPNASGTQARFTTAAATSPVRPTPSPDGLDARAKKIVIERTVAVVAPDQGAKAPASPGNLSAPETSSRRMRPVASPTRETNPAFYAPLSITNTTTVTRTAGAEVSTPSNENRPVRGSDGRLIFMMKPIGAQATRATQAVPGVANVPTDTVRVSPISESPKSVTTAPTTTLITPARTTTARADNVPSRTARTTPSIENRTRSLPPLHSLPLATSQSFLNLNDTASLSQKFSSAKSVKVLSSFKLHISGDKIEIRDDDGSIYRGSVMGDQQDITPEQRQQIVTQLRNKQLPATGFRFNATGVNRTLRQPVSFDAFYAPVASGQSGAKTTVGASRQIIFQAQPPQVRIQGQAIVNQQNRITVNAVSQGR